MAAVGFTWCVSGLAVDRHSYVFIVGYLLTSLPFALLFHMLCAFPTGRLEGRFAHAAVALGYFLTTVLWWVILLFYDTTRDQWAANPIMAFDDQSTADTLLSIQSSLASSRCWPCRSCSGGAGGPRAVRSGRCFCRSTPSPPCSWSCFSSRSQRTWAPCPKAWRRRSTSPAS